DAKLVNRILDFEKNLSKYHRNIYKNNKWFIEYKIDGLDEFHAESGYSYEIVDLNIFKDKDITKFFYLAEEKNTEDLEKRLRKEFSDELTVTLSSPHCLELLKKNAHKGTAIRKIADFLKIPLEETLAFGDGLNDYEMLSSVGQGFIMANASQRLKEKLPNLEVIGNCDEDGVAKKLEEIFLNEI
ncbi:MAG: HAD-IIB family hydrolase, partial [Fusobacterium sp.]|nr:HAD-IIB family hydrolase [Fusobacterium sp.]